MGAMDGKTVLVVSGNLFFLPRIQNAAGPHGLTVRQAATGDAFWDSLGQDDVTLVLVDLEADRDIWSPIVEELVSREDRPRIVAYGPHSDVEGLETARSLGCDAVVTKGQFSRDLHLIVAGGEAAPPVEDG